ncbi:MAG TPA: peptide chain release factor 1 [Tepidisphaeraceae bacterium]|nr:peptide chain release factor 1 [Tepidisphaeraceae bacterium]
MPSDAIPAPLLHRLEEMRQRYQILQTSLHDPAVLANSQKLVARSKEIGRLQSTIEKYERFRKAEKNVQELTEMIANRADPDMSALAAAEFEPAQKSLAALADELKSEFLAAQDQAVDGFFLEIRAGTGGDEAGLFVGDLFEMYRKYTQSKGWKLEVSDFSPGERGGMKEVIAYVNSPAAYRHLRFEAGGHRVQRVPITEAQGRIHTSAATVAVLPEMPDVKIDINPKDVEESGCRGGGPGGQNVNKVETGWRILHKPTGLWFKMTEHKSQAQNKERAWALLRATLYEAEQAKQHAAVTGARRAMMGSGDRSQRIRTYNFPQNRCTDHRLGGGEEGGKNFNLERIMSGDLDDLVNALTERDNADRLSALGE